MGLNSASDMMRQAIEMPDGEDRDNLLIFADNYRMMVQILQDACEELESYDAARSSAV